MWRGSDRGAIGRSDLLEKMDNTQLGSANVAIEKARSAALFKRPTKAFQDLVAAGGGRYAFSAVTRCGAAGGRDSAGVGWKDCWARIGFFRRDERAGLAVREGGRGFNQVARAARPG